jgi:hypothetical protein
MLAVNTTAPVMGAMAASATVQNAGDRNSVVTEITLCEEICADPWGLSEAAGDAARSGGLSITKTLATTQIAESAANNQ